MKLREEVRWLGEKYQASQQRICGLMEIEFCEPASDAGAGADSL